MGAMSPSPYRHSEVFAFIIYAVIAGLTLFPPSIPLLKLPPVVQKALLMGNDPFVAPGSEFHVFKALLPEREKVSFILDHPFNPYVPNIDKIYSAQSFFTPRVISPETKERAAIVFCSNDEIAKKRLDESGYRMLVPLGDGKGVAAKVNS